MRKDVALDEVVVYVRAGAVLALQREVIQHTRTAQAGGVLQVQLYAGANGSTFDLVEDDGNSTASHRRPSAGSQGGTRTWRPSCSRRTPAVPSTPLCSHLPNQGRWTSTTPPLWRPCDEWSDNTAGAVAFAERAVG